MTWQPIDTAPKDGTEILTLTIGAIDIASWKGVRGWEGWSDREGRIFFPCWWQPLPDHPPLPGEAQP